MASEEKYKSHETAIVEDGANIGSGTRVWHLTHVRSGAKIGSDCIIGGQSYVDSGVILGDNVKVQSQVLLYHGVVAEDGVFIGPGVRTTNDMYPRAINMDGSLKSGTDWEVAKTLLKYGSSIGANATIRCGITVGEWAMVGAGSVVTRDVPDYGLVIGNPARLIGLVDEKGHKLNLTDVVDDEREGLVGLTCGECYPIYVPRELQEEAVRNGLSRGKQK